VAAPLPVEVALSVDPAECKDSQSPDAGVRDRECSDLRLSFCRLIRAQFTPV
jgi:hypothetical protein